MLTAKSVSPLVTNRLPGDSEFRFFFSREESRVHVHVSHPDNEAKFWLKPTIELARNSGLSSSKIKEAERLVVSRQQEILMPGTTTFEAKVTNISGHCTWMFIDDEELALPYSELPWFKAATIQQIINVNSPTDHHLCWPDLDVDLSLESIRDNEKFTLRAKTTFQPCHSAEPPPESL